MDDTLRELNDMLQQWRALASDLQAQGEAFGDEYAFGALYGLQVCEADLQRAINKLTRQANAARGSHKTHLFTRLPNRRGAAPNG